MSTFNFNYILIQNQDYICDDDVIFEEDKQIYRYTSHQNPKNVVCPECGSKVYCHGYSKIRLHDVPTRAGKPTFCEMKQHRYKCKTCKATFMEENPIKGPGYNMTNRCLEWICALLVQEIPTNTIAKIFGLNWNTIRSIQSKRLKSCLKKFDEAKLQSSYRPYYLAVDEFALHKGHNYATCVMDLANGEVIWVGKGRSMKDFAKFFEHFAHNDYLSKVVAVAMDMNASYNKLVEEKMPQASIVYDRYHVQAQFGRDVMGQVRLAEARMHKERSKELVSQKASRAEISAERKTYSMIKNARWTLLKNSEHLSSQKQATLNEILESHSNLAICYAMKEEMIELFEITDVKIAEERWKKWFDAAINSGIAPLVRFARQKLKRIKGLVAHALWQINTGRLEGFNNKIKVAKRNAYGFRNSDYFFSYIRYLSCINSSRFHKIL